jgi:hypothetical protein
MDLEKAIQDLSARKKQLDAAIATLESLISGPAGRVGAKKRGRKQMSAEERRIVSARMSNYWATRRKQNSE